MKAQVLKGIENLSFEEVSLKKPGPGELLIRVRACAICGTDIKIYHHGHRLITFPRIPGHELAGEVVEVGEGVEDFSPGDRVAVAPAVPCGKCYYCLRGEQAMCENLRAIGYFWDGGFAEYMRVPREAMVGGCVNKLPENVSFEEGALAEPLACAINGQELMRIESGDSVAVIGGGPLGLIHARLSKVKGAGKVILLEVNRDRLKIAEEKKVGDYYLNPTEEGVKDKIREITGGRGVDKIIVACGVPDAQKLALDLVAPLGVVNFFGGLPRNFSQVELDTNLIHYKECFVVGTHGSAPQHNRKALELLKKKLLQVKDIITHRLPLSRLRDGMRVVERGEGLKVIINPGEEET